MKRRRKEGRKTNRRKIQRRNKKSGKTTRRVYERMEEVEVEDGMKVGRTSINRSEDDRTSETRLRSDDGVEYGMEIEGANIITDHQHTATQHVSSIISPDKPCSPYDDVDFLITENQKLEVAEWDTDASIGRFHTPSVSGWPVINPELDHIGSLPTRYFQYPTDTESTHISIGCHDSFVYTTNCTNKNNSNVTETSAEFQNSA